eukprot:6096768-Lingulodinium_polyedra.AAC.1
MAEGCAGCRRHSCGVGGASWAGGPAAGPVNPTAGCSKACWLRVSWWLMAATAASMTVVPCSASPIAETR